MLPDTANFYEQVQISVCNVHCKLLYAALLKTKRKKRQSDSFMIQEKLFSLHCLRGHAVLYTLSCLFIQTFITSHSSKDWLLKNTLPHLQAGHCLTSVPLTATVTVTSLSHFLGQASASIHSLHSLQKKQQKVWTRYRFSVFTTVLSIKVEG